MYLYGSFGSEHLLSLLHPFTCPADSQKITVLEGISLLLTLKITAINLVGTIDVQFGGFDFSGPLLRIAVIFGLKRNFLVDFFYFFFSLFLV